MKKIAKISLVAALLFTGISTYAIDGNGDFNLHGLKQTPDVRIRNKHPAHFQFHMRY